MKKFKTKITGSLRTKVMHLGLMAARNEWERKSPYVGCREEEAWYAGFDEHINNPSTLVHCTICGAMHNKEKCEQCGDETSQRPGIDTGDIIYMTITTGGQDEKT